MNNKPRSKNVDDVKLAVATIAVTATFGFWNFFSKQDIQAADAINAQADIAQVVATQTVTPGVPQVVPTQPVQQNILVVPPTQQNTLVIPPTQPVPTVLLPTAQPTVLPTALPTKKSKTANDTGKQTAKTGGTSTKTGSSK
jgi:hypothetical protein